MTLTDEPIGHPSPEHAEACFAMASLNDGALVGVTDTSCMFWRLERGSRQPIRKTIEVAGHTDGAPLVIGDNWAFGSSHAMQRFWSIDLDTGQGRDLGQCSLGGQANAMHWDDARGQLFLANYPERRIRTFDPAAPAVFPDNPGTFARMSEPFCRFSHQLLRIGQTLWTCAPAVLPRLGGAIVRIDLTSRQVEAFADLVPDECPGEMVLGLDGRTLYLGTTVQADCGTNIATSPAAHLLAFDSQTGKLTRCERPIEGAQTLSALCLDMAGRMLFLDGARLTCGRCLWAWDVAMNRFERIGTVPDGLREIVPSPDGSSLWATAFEGMGPLTLGAECRIDFQRGMAMPGNRWDQKMCKHLQWRQGQLWCTCFTEVLRFGLARSPDAPEA